MLIKNSLSAWENHHPKWQAKEHKEVKKHFTESKLVKQEKAGETVRSEQPCQILKGRPVWFKKKKEKKLQQLDKTKKWKKSERKRQIR